MGLLWWGVVTAAAMTRGKELPAATCECLPAVCCYLHSPVLLLPLATEVLAAAVCLLKLSCCCRFVCYCSLRRIGVQQHGAQTASLLVCAFMDLPAAAGCCTRCYCLQEWRGATRHPDSFLSGAACIHRPACCCRALYKTLLSSEVARSNKAPMFMSLLFKAMKADVSFRRKAAFAKRLLQVSLEQTPAFACGCLLILSELLKVGRPSSCHRLPVPSLTA